MYPFRVFLSYARVDLALVGRIIDCLRRQTNLVPIWDEDLSAGEEFNDGIRRRIAQAHIFMPLLTSNSRDSAWVHQEIGYALGIDVPVVPLASGALPEGLISGLHAVAIEGEMSGWCRKFSGRVQRSIDSLTSPRYVDGDLERLGITTHLADLSEERTRMLARCAEGIRKPARVRQRAIFSSFSLPDASPEAPAWAAIELPERRSESLRRSLRDERRVLEEHARAAGCSLIINPVVDYSSVGRGAHRTQLKTLKAFLTSMPADSCQVGILRGRFVGNLTIIGDWFGAKALPPEPGREYRQSVFCHHAPTVLRWIDEFDRELAENLPEVDRARSRDNALRVIDDRLRELT